MRIVAALVGLLLACCAPAPLAGCVPTVTLNGGRVVGFGPAPDHSWVLEFPAGEGDHRILVDLCDVHRELALHVIREVPRG